MKARVESLAILLFALLATVTALADTTDPFGGFIGMYRVMDVECVRDGYPAKGCDLLYLNVFRDDDDKVALRETMEELTITLVPGAYELGRDDSRVVSRVSGDGVTSALWERFHIKNGESSIINLRWLYREGEALYYHVVWRDGGVDGVWLIKKATYLLR